MSGRRKPDRLVLTTVKLMVSFVVAEILLQVLYALSVPVRAQLDSPWDKQAVTPVVPDERLGHRPSPTVHGHDRRGFRNRHSLRQADIVVLGDSQTYGAGVQRHEAWPAVLSRKLDVPVYSMAYGGYGPAHYLRLFDEAAALDPRILIIALYLGNDLYDAYEMFIEGRLPGDYDDAVPRTVALRTREREHPFKDEVSSAMRFGERRPERSPNPTPDEERRRGLVSTHCRLYGLIRRIRYRFVEAGRQDRKSSEQYWTSCKSLASHYPEYCEVLETGKFRTILTPRYRAMALNVDDDRIAAGLLVAERALVDLDEMARKHGAEVILVMIPTKEYVCKDLVSSMSPSYEQLVRHEKYVKQRLKSVLPEREMVDLGVDLAGAAAAGIPVYGLSHDGHPSGIGHGVIAQAVLSVVDERDHK